MNIFYIQDKESLLGIHEMSDYEKNRGAQALHPLDPSHKVRCGPSVFPGNPRPPPATTNHIGAISWDMTTKQKKSF